LGVGLGLCLGFGLASGLRLVLGGLGERLGLGFGLGDLLNGQC